MKKKWTLVDEQLRSKLGEGRNYGLGFAFAKREDSKLITVGPISPCKDYLSDQIFSEATGKPYQACGYSAHKTKCFDKNGYLIMSVLKRFGYDANGKFEPVGYPRFQKDLEDLDKNWKNMQKFINVIEEKLKLKERTEINKIEENIYVSITPLFWTSATYLISLYSLFLRVAMHWNGEGDPLEYAGKITNNDAYMVKTAIPVFERMLKEGVPQQDFKASRSWHGFGICALPQYWKESGQKIV